jgi:hypothetical protein
MTLLSKSHYLFDTVNTQHSTRWLLNLFFRHPNTTREQERNYMFSQLIPRLKYNGHVLRFTFWTKLLICFLSLITFCRVWLIGTNKWAGTKARPSAVRFMGIVVIWTAVFMICKTINPNPFTINKTALQLVSCQRRRDT